MESTRIEYQQHHYLTEYKQVSTGKRIIVVGESSSGPLHEPTLVNSKKVAEAIYEGGPLVDRLVDMLDQNEALNVYLMRIETGEFIYAMDVIKSLDFDILVFDSLDFHEDNYLEIETYINLADEKASNGRLVHAFFNTREIGEIKELHNVFSMINAMRTSVGMEVEELGKYVSVVADQMAGRSSAAVYASIVLGLELGESPVNKKINAELKKHFTKDEIRLLRDSGIVCFRDSYHNGVVCASPTCAVSTPGSVHKNIANLRVVQQITNEISEKLGALVGEMYNSQTIYKAKSLVDTVLETNKVNNVLSDYDYDITNNELKGYMLVTLELVPIFTVEKIVTHTQVRILK